MAKVIDIANKYIGRELEYGVLDCNLMVVEYIDSLEGTEYLHKMTVDSSYTSIRGGVRVARKHFNVSNIKDYLDLGSYEIKENKNLATIGDILVRESDHTCCLHLGRGILCINNDDIFTQLRTSELDLTDFTVYKYSGGK